MSTNQVASAADILRESSGGPFLSAEEKEALHVSATAFYVVGVEPATEGRFGVQTLFFIRSKDAFGDAQRTLAFSHNAFRERLAENIQKALRAEREQRRQEAQRARLYEQNISAMEQRIQAWQQQTLAQQLQTPPPDPYESPEQARQRLVQQQNMLQQLHAAEQQRQAQIAQQAHQEQQFQYVAQSVEDYEGEFKAQNPDYDDATDYLLDTQRALLAEAGYPPHVAEQQVAAWSVSVAQQALQANKNPAEWAYAMAKRMGYQPKGTGAKAAAETLAAMQAGQASSKTLSGGGAAAKSGTNLKQIASLEGAAFDSAMEKYLSDAIRGR